MGTQLISDLGFDVVFIAVIAIFVIVGACKGAIRSIGGLIALVISYVLSRALALPVTVMLFNRFNIEPAISQFLQSMNNAMAESAVPADTPALLDGIGGSLTNKILNGISGAFNTTAVHVGSILVMLLLFAVFITVFGLLIRLADKAFKMLPLGKGLNAAGGAVCGLVKGLIVSILIYLGMNLINQLLGINIPIHTGFFNRIFAFLNGLQL